MDLVNSQLVATQHQLQHLQERYNDLASGHIVLLQQVVQLQKIVKNHDGVMHRVMGFLHSVDAQRRNSRVPGMLPNGSNGIGINDLIGQGPDDHPASPLQQASELLGEFSAENLINKDLLERMTVDYSFRDEYSTPPNDQSASSGLGPTSNGLMGYLSTSQDLDNVVYPVGQTNGIDPINSEHIHNIPYALPASGMIAPDHSDMLIAKPMVQERKPSMSDPAWGSRKPRVLLVEDDKICARIGCKFLARFECGVETAVSCAHSAVPPSPPLTQCSAMA
jgi:osomolarity two-component system response regulator SKN7